MIEIKLPCEPGTIIRVKKDNFSGCIICFQTICSSPFSPSHNTLARVIDVNDENNMRYYVSYDGVFPEYVEIIE